MLSYEDGGKAMDWMASALGFTERERMVDEAGRLAHGEMALGEQVVMLASPEGYRSPKSLQKEHGDAVPWLNDPWIFDGVVAMVDDVDAVLSRAVPLGAVLLSEPEDGFPGRRVRIADPEGHRWYLIQREKTSSG
jgi:uncharacterized glyoxalase superfamily protein PhnB